MQNKNTESINEMVELLKRDKDTLFGQFFSTEPEDDKSYLEILFYYYQLIYQSNNWYADLFSSQTEIGMMSVNLETALGIKEVLKKTYTEKINDLKFKPVLEQYLEQYDSEEIEHLRKIIVVSIFVTIKNSTSIISSASLASIAHELNIPFDYILTLSHQHKIFKDKVIHLSEISYSQELLISRDLYTNPKLYHVFAGIPLTDEDIIGLADYPSIIPYLKEDDRLLIESHSQAPDKELSKNNLPEDGYDVDTGIEMIDIIMQELEEGPEQLEPEQDADIDDSDITRYKTDIEYLYFEYQWIKLLFNLREAEESSSSRWSINDDNRAIDILKSSYRRSKNLAEIQLNYSLQRGFKPRLELFSDKIGLSEFEKDIVKTLIVKQLFKSEAASATIEELLYLLEGDEIKAIEGRKYFLKSSTLVRKGIIFVEEDILNSNSLLKSSVSIDFRLAEYFSGQNHDISNYINGSHIYISNMKMENVIMPEATKTQVIRNIGNFQTYLNVRKKLEFDSTIEYGKAMVMLFVGPSGTGKTMLANAVSCYLNKKILAFNLNNISQLERAASSGSFFSVIFREARMNNAILFFDESEILLTERFPELLIEIEKHDGIVIFATNAAFRMEEALRRRINLIIKLHEPGPALRKSIWNVHLFELPKKLNISEDVDIDSLAENFELTGGFIKNAVFSALSKAVNDMKGETPEITMLHLVEAAKEQLQNKMFFYNLDKNELPKKGFEHIVLSENASESIREIVNYEKASKVLNGEWGFNEVFPDNNGLIALFHGPSGVGKSLAAEVIAFELGKTLRVINYAQIASEYIGESEKAMEALFTENNVNESILLFDEADALFASRSGIGNSTDRYANQETGVLLSLIERKNVLAILTTNSIENIDKAFFRRFQYIVEFKKPNAGQRLKLWETLLPEKMPKAEDLNLGLLAKRYNMTGGLIRKAVINAATSKALELDMVQPLTTEELCRACEKILAANNYRNEQPIGFGV